MKKILVFIALLLFAFTLTACSSDDVLDKGAKQEDEVLDENQTPETMQLTLEELSVYNGKDGNMAYIAVDGNIYDVTNKWSNGEHNGVTAGTDATAAINNAPHGKGILEDLELVGELIE